MYIEVGEFRWDYSGVNSFEFESDLITINRGRFVSYGAPNEKVVYIHLLNHVTVKFREPESLQFFQSVPSEGEALKVLFSLLSPEDTVKLIRTLIKVTTERSHREGKRSLQIELQKLLGM